MGGPQGRQREETRDPMLNKWMRIKGLDFACAMLALSAALAAQAGAQEAKNAAAAPAPAAAPAGAPAAQVADPEAENHGAVGIGARKVHAGAKLDPSAAMAGDRAAALQAIEEKLSCVCLVNGDLDIDATKSLRAESCTCPYAATVRTDLADALATLPTAMLGDKRTVAEQIESTFVPKAAEYERVFRYPVDDFNWWMDNVRCVCDGCKPTVFFSKCQLSCTPAILYKLRSRIFLAMGFTRDELLDYYLAEFNDGKAPREQKDRAWLLPRKERDRAWMVPLFVLLGAVGTLGFAVRRWASKRNSAGTQDNLAAAAPAADTAATAAARARLLDELDRDDED